MSIRTLLALAVIAVAPLPAQLASPNSTGAAIGHVHLNVTDIDAHQRFWKQLGGVAIMNDKLVMMQFPGIYVILRKQDSTGGTVGSNINHFGFHVKNMDDWTTKWKAAGIAIEPGNNPKQLFLTAPDNVRVEIIEDATISTPIAMHHIHMFVTDPKEVQAWYVKHFGAIAGKRNAFDTANVPGAELTLGKQDTAQVATKGRSLDHMGFEVKNLDQFTKTLQADGIQLEAPGVRASANAPNLRIAYIFDPWGTYIELTEGLTPKGAQRASR
jgi:catechol 2,3-dioxygenase-like lactoylglutathione lyase family enzyme